MWLFVELSGLGFIGSWLCGLVSWPVAAFLRLGEGFIGLGRFVSSVGTEIGIYSNTAFYLGTGLF